MARFATEDSAHIEAIRQVIYEWASELDRGNGLSILDSNVLSGDCEYFVGGEWRHGAAAVAQFYKDRHARLSAGDGVPVMRHIISNLRLRFSDLNLATVNYLLVFFAAIGSPPFTNYCDPIAVADVEMRCRREPDGHWRICRFESAQIFRRS